MDWSPKNTAVSWAGWAIAQPIISLAFLAGLPRERSARGTEPHTHGIDSIRILRQSWDELALIMNARLMRGPSRQEDKQISERTAAEFAEFKENF